MNLRKSNWRGLSLLELVIVMSVLAALAAIVIPMLPNLLRRAHKVVDATQTSEVAKAVQLYQGLYVSYPDNFDLLTDGTTFPAYLPTDGGAFGGYVTADTLTVDEQKALKRVGVLRAQKLAADRTPSGFHPTRSPYPTNTSAGIVTDLVTIDGTATAKFAVLNTASLSNGLLQAEVASDLTARYVVFGVGPRSSMVNTVIQDAPMSVPQKKEFTPDNTYSRVGVIFKVSGVEVGRTERARFIASVALEDDELESTEKDIAGYYEVASGTN